MNPPFAFAKQALSHFLFAAEIYCLVHVLYEPHTLTRNDKYTWRLEMHGIWSLLFESED
jgi:hypothetical protein